MITDGHRKEKDTVLKKKHSRKKVTHKMVKHTQSIRQLLLTNFLSVFDSFVGLTLKGFASHICTIYS